MKPVALVPFKCFTRAKRRLRSAFSDDEVEQIGRAMLADVLEALAGAASLDEVRVLTDDEEVAEVARRAGARVRLQVPDPGLNPAIEQAGSEALDEGREATLVVLGDLPGLRARDVETVLAEGARAPVVIVPSADGGTALLYRRPPDVMPARFGPESAALHEKEAHACGIEPVVLVLDERASLDLDTPEDVERVLASGVESRTSAVLARVMR